MKVKKLWTNLFALGVVVFLNSVNGYAQSSLAEQKIRATQIQQQDAIQKNKQTIQLRQQGKSWTNRLLNVFNLGDRSHQSGNSSDSAIQKTKQLQADNQRKIEQAKIAAENAKRMQEQRLQMMRNSSSNRKR